MYSDKREYWEQSTAEMTSQLPAGDREDTSCRTARDLQPQRGLKTRGAAESSGERSYCRAERLLLPVDGPLWSPGSWVSLLSTGWVNLDKELNFT